MSSWNFLDPACLDTLLALVQREAEGMFALVETDEAWTKPTGAGHWQAREQGRLHNLKCMGVFPMPGRQGRCVSLQATSTTQ